MRKLEENALVSVIVPVYNVEKYLRRCVDSILAQTYRNFELILVDDGSSDNCPAICDEYARKDSRIVVIHKANGGLSSARNAGIEYSTGEWLMFVDSDDYIASQMAERLLQTAVEHDAQIAFCTLRAFYEDKDGYHEYVLWGSPHEDALSGEEILRISAKERCGLLSGHHVVAWNKIYRRDVFDAIRYPDKQLHEDEAIAHRIIGSCKMIVGIDEPLYYYRQRPDSIMGGHSQLWRQLSIALAYGDRILFYGTKDYCILPGQLFHRYWTALIGTFYLFESDLRCKQLVDKIRLQMKKVGKLYRKTDVSLIKKLGIRVFCCFPRLTSRLFCFSVKLRSRNN